jgi:hypothetical protein
MLHFYAEQHTIENKELDHYNRRGVALGRDAAHKVIAALHRDANEHEHRGGESNLQEALEMRVLARNIGKIIADS